jgi:hypothetical protein
VLRNFNVASAKACVFSIDDMTATNRAVITLRKLCPNLPLIVRAKNVQHQKKLENMFGTYNRLLMSDVKVDMWILLIINFFC